MPRPVCVKCQAEMDFPKAGVLQVDTYTEHLLPYKAYQADLYQCRYCGAQVLVGRAIEPIATINNGQMDGVLARAKLNDELFFNYEHHFHPLRKKE